MSIDLAYAELGLRPGASESEVRAAWRRLVSRWHPDRNTSADAVDLMQRINGAYERIRDAAFGREAPGHRPEPARRRKAAPAAEAAPLRTVRRRVRLSLEEAALGCTRVLRGRLTDTCVDCVGLGVVKPAATCTECEGAGSVRRPAWFGWLATESACAACDGSGFVSRACPSCAGQGMRTQGYQRSVRIPSGVRADDLLRAESSGDAPGDFAVTLELQVKVSAHPLFTVGDDGTLRCDMPVDGFAWIASAWIEVPTLTGLQQMRLRRGRQVYRLRGQGLPLERRSTTRGDYLVTVQPSFPEVLSDTQEKLLAQLASSSDSANPQGAAAPLRTWQRSVQAWESARSRDAAASR